MSPRNIITRPFAYRPSATPRLRRRPVWERALRPLARVLQCLSVWLWHRDAKRAVERRVVLNTPWPSRPWSFWTDHINGRDQAWKGGA